MVRKDINQHSPHEPGMAHIRTFRVMLQNNRLLNQNDYLEMQFIHGRIGKIESCFLSGVEVLCPCHRKAEWSFSPNMQVLQRQTFINGDHPTSHE